MRPGPMPGGATAGVSDPSTRGLPNRRGTRRRRLLLAMAGLVGIACVRPTPRAAPDPPRWEGPEVAAYDAEARSLLADAIEALHTFDAQAAYRISSTPNSGLRSSREIEWETPPPAAWRRARAIAADLTQRADVLFQQVRTAQPDPAVWRDRRARAEAAYALTEMASALAAYGAEVDRLEADSDGGPALPILARGWNRWSEAADYWGVSAGELIECA